MSPILWTVIAIATPCQSDNGSLRVRYVYAYGLAQAWAYAQKDYGQFADVIHVYPSEHQHHCS